MRLPLWWRRDREERLAEEIRSHLQMAVRDRVQRGETAEQAEPLPPSRCCSRPLAFTE
jgi:hypothetical protein